MGLQVKKIRRTLKVYGKASPRDIDYVFVPEIKISGMWLQACGFEMGQTIAVHVDEGVLTIKPVP